MIKRVIGVLAALVAIAVIVVVTLHAGRFTSLVFDEGEPASAVEAAVESSAEPQGEGVFVEPVMQPDSLRASDSVTLRR